MDELGASTILGVDPGAGVDEIRAAWRTAAAEHHPDRGGDSRRFAQARSAYETLIEAAEARDAVRVEPVGFVRGVRGDTIRRELRITFHQGVLGAARTISQTRKVRCSACGGYGRTATTVANPAGVVCHRCAGEGRRQTVSEVVFDVPAGVTTGDVIVVANAGDVGAHRGPTGELHLEVLREPHTFLRAVGSDLHRGLRVTFTEAALGAVRRVEGLDGTVEVTVPAGTQNGAMLTVEGHGAPKTGGGRGALVCTVDVEVPTVLDDEQRQLLCRLAQLRGETSHLLGT